MKLRLIATAILAVFVAQPSLAASSAWHKAAGGRVRLVTAGPLSADGILRGALQIELQPGWKTYWRDPGSSGVPPQIDLASGGEWTSAEVDFPAPQWHRDDYGSWAGYDYSVALPVTFRAAPGKAPAAISGSVFLGICETICVPLQAPMALDIDRTATPAADSAVVDNAWAALPKPAGATFQVSTSAVGSEGELQVSVIAPAGPVQLFVAGEQGYALGTPRPTSDGRFAIKIITRPKLKPNGPGLRYTLATPVGAVAGFIDYP